MSAVPRKPTMVAIPAISILHLSHTTREEYLVGQYGDVADGLSFMVAPHDNGYFMTVPACHAQADDEQREEWATIPADLRSVFDYIAPHAMFAWFMLDVDGDVMAGLPVADEDARLDENPLERDPMAGEHCDSCHAELESSQIGLCDDCQEDDEPHGIINHYACPNCAHAWMDEWNCEVEEDCNACGTRHISPTHSEKA